MKIIDFPIDKLVPYARNQKIHSEAQLKKLAKLIDHYGFTQPVVADEQGVIIIGHGRTEAARLLGRQTVPVVFLNNLSEREIQALRLADNRVSEAPWDTDLLRFELQTLGLDDFDLGLTAFDEDEINSLLKEVETEEPKEKPEPQDTVILTRTGETWKLNGSRLMVAETNKAFDVMLTAYCESSGNDAFRESDGKAWSDMLAEA